MNFKRCRRCLEVLPLEPTGPTVHGPYFFNQNGQPQAWSHVSLFYCAGGGSK